MFSDNKSASSSPVPPPYEEKVSVCCLSLHEGDKIRLLNVPLALHDPFAQVLTQAWRRGIQNRSAYGESVQFKLSGYPWYGQGDQAVPSRVLIAEIMTFMYKNGWAIYLATDLSKKQSDKDSWYFRRVTPDPRARFAAISFNRTDRVRFIGLPPDLTNSLLNCVRSTWSRGIQQQSDYHGAVELKLAGNPWWASGTETVDARKLVLHLLSAIDNNRWCVYASVDASGMQGSNDNPHGDLDTWVLKSQ